MSILTYFQAKVNGNRCSILDTRYSIEKNVSRITPDSINKEATVEGRLCGDLRCDSRISAPSTPSINSGQVRFEASLGAALNT
jgi:hypothetical protein